MYVYIRTVQNPVVTLALRGLFIALINAAPLGALRPFGPIRCESALCCFQLEFMRPVGYSACGGILSAENIDKHTGTFTQAIFQIKSYVTRSSATHLRSAVRDRTRAIVSRSQKEARLLRKSSYLKVMYYEMLGRVLFVSSLDSSTMYNVMFVTVVCSVSGVSIPTSKHNGSHVQYNLLRKDAQKAGAKSTTLGLITKKSK